MHEYFGFAACAQLGRADTLPKDPCPPVYYFLLLTLVLVVLLLVEYAVVAVVVGSATCSTVAATMYCFYSRSSATGSTGRQHLHAMHFKLFLPSSVLYLGSR